MLTIVDTRSADPSQTIRARQISRLKLLVWIYFILLIFEGAIRKWIPPLATIFLIARDPIALLLWLNGARLRIGSRRSWTIFYVYAWIITTLGLLQLLVGVTNPVVVLYGWRSYVLHIPSIIVLGSVLDLDDLKSIAKWLLLISIPMTVLMIFQYLAPFDSFINRGASEGGLQITGALGHIRPAGTFSFISGPIAFYPLVAVMCLWGLAHKDLIPKWLLVSAAIATVIVIPVSVSRSLALMVLAVVATALIGFVLRGGITFRPQLLPQFTAGAVVAAVVLVSVAQIPLVRDATNTFMTRWTEAQGEAGDNSDLEARIASLFTDALNPVSRTPVLGTGIGSGSTVAAALNNQVLAAFAFSENALQREVFELGSWLGPVFVAARIFLSVALLVQCFSSLKTGEVLPWLLVAPAMVSLSQSGLDQATSQGFVVVVLGVSLAALRVSKQVALRENIG